MIPSRPARLIVGLAMLALAFVAACLVIRSAFPFPDIPNVHAKIVHFREHPNDYDTLFIGSSRLNYQVIPSQFDRLSREPSSTKTIS